jgi:nitroimidazol reductase NimA-like FMN-containing flavoprotein (pyridoxamine 5'-phosphate oxidase superfamily)
VSDWQAFLAERPIGVIATVSADGTPHAVPVEVVVSDGLVYCWCKARSLKARNAARAGRAALVAYKGNSFALVRGSARVLHEGDARYEPVARAFLTKYRREETYGNDTLIEITPERISTAELG